MSAQALFQLGAVPQALEHCGPGVARQDLHGGADQDGRDDAQGCENDQDHIDETGQGEPGVQLDQGPHGIWPTATESDLGERVPRPLP